MNQKSTHRHHYIRTGLASFFGVAALLLVLMSSVVIWLNRTLTDTDSYVRTVRPLITQPQVQNYFAQIIIEEVQKADPTQQLGHQLLPPAETNAMTATQIQEATDSRIRFEVIQTLNSAEFKTVWENTNRTAHEQLIRQLEADHSDAIVLDLSPAMIGLFKIMTANELAPLASAISIPASAANFEFNGNAIMKVHDAYVMLKKASAVILIITLSFIGFSVWLSVHHAKTLRRISLATGLVLMTLGFVLGLASLIKLSGINTTSSELTTAIVGTVTHTLQVTCYGIGAVLVVASIGSKVYQKHRIKRAKSE